MEQAVTRGEKFTASAMGRREATRTTLALSVRNHLLAR